jgi:hypothetical protein
LRSAEHLENPYHFFRASARLLTSDGYLLLSTPNLESWMARLVYFWKGELPWFGEKGWRENGHKISQFSWQLRIAARQSGLELQDSGHTDNRFMLAAGPAGAVAGLVKRFALIAIRPIMRGNRDGDISLFLFRRSGESDVLGPDAICS